MKIQLDQKAKKITEPLELIRTSLNDINVAALMMSIVHMTGDTSIFKGDIKPVILGPVDSGSGDAEGQCGFSGDQVRQVKDLAMNVIAKYIEGGCKTPTLPEGATDEMLTYMCGRKLDQDYSEFIKEEIAINGVDYRSVEFKSQALKAQAQQFPVVIIGAGMGGILAGIRLQEANIPYTIIEKNPGVGGTWYENKYPGCRVDVPGHSYSYSFEPNHDWQCHFPVAEDIQAYYVQCSKKYDVEQNIRFSTEVVDAAYDDATNQWLVRIQDESGKIETLQAASIISAVGQLNRPKLPEIDGIETFNGQLFHSGAWDESCSLDGKRVAVIGAGASAFQIIPELAKTAENLTVFQRSAAWMFPNTAYHSEVEKGQQWALEKLPFYSKWYRFWLFYSSVEGVYEQTRVDSNWSSSASVSQSNDQMRENLTAWIASQVNDPALLEKVVPDYPPFSKRVLQDNGGYLSAVQQDNVELCTDGIEKIVKNGVVTKDGVVHEVDIIVCATGFHATHFLHPMTITGRNGVKLSDQWGNDNGRAYLGISVPNFPNLFCIYGPNTNLVVAGSIAHNAESQVNYIMQCYAMLFEGGHKSMDCKPAVHDAYNVRVDEVNASAAWGTPNIDNWYKNSAGRVTANLPFRVIEYWKMTKKVDSSDYRFF